MAPVPAVRSCNAANQISSAGYSYDANGNLRVDGVTTSTWDRAARAEHTIVRELCRR